LAAPDFPAQKLEDIPDILHVDSYQSRVELVSNETASCF